MKRRLLLLTVIFFSTWGFGQGKDLVLNLCGIKDGDTTTFANVMACDSLNFVNLSSGLPSPGYAITEGEIIVAGVPGIGFVRSGGKFEGKATSLFSLAAGRKVWVSVKYKRPDGITAMTQMIFFVLK